MTTQPGKYMYCIFELPGSNAQSPGEVRSVLPLELAGIDPSYPSLSLVVFQDLACVVSDTTLKEYPVTREYSLAHQRVIESVMKDYPVLPIAFSTVAVSEQAIVEKVLQPRYEEFKNLLRWVSDKIEVGLKVYWKQLDGVFQKLVEESQEIRTLKETISSKPPTATYFERIKVGEKVKEAFERKKKELQERILEALKPHALEVKANSTYGDAMVFNAAFFVKKENETRFDQVLNELAAGSNGNLQFKYVGPVPPFNFVTVRIRWE